MQDQDTRTMRRLPSGTWRRALAALAIAGAASGLPASNASAQGMPPGFTLYENARFGTSTLVPADGFKADPGPENGDGRSWSALKGGGKLFVYGGYLVLSDSIAGERDRNIQDAAASGIQIAYKASRDNWFVWSGRKGDTIYYEKTLLTNDCKADVLNTVHIEYPAAEQDRYKPIVEEMAKSLKGGKGIDCLQ